MSNDLTIHALHNDILRKLPFTVSGNASIEKTVFKFLQEVADSPFLISNRQITFVMGGFAKIKLDDLSELFEHKWQTRRLRSFFFYDYEDDQVEPILSLYRYCLEELTRSEVNGEPNFKNITNIICDNNHSGVNFRVRIIKGDKSQRIKITHIRRERVLEAQIPIGFYNEVFKRTNLAETLTSSKTCVERSGHNPYQYFNSDGFEDSDRSDYAQVASEIFAAACPASFKESYDNYVLSATENKARFSEVLKNSDAEIKEIYYLFYIAGLLAYLLDCDIEYFTSVSNNLGENKKFSLGSIAVGYKAQSAPQLSSDIRAFFNIVSNHIAQNLATQILLDTSRMQYYIAKRKEQEQFIKDFSAEFLEGLSPHCGKKNKVTSERLVPHSKKLGKQIVARDGIVSLNESEYKVEDINKSFGEDFIDYLNKVLDFTDIDYGLYQGFHGTGTCCRELNKFYQYYENDELFGFGLTLYERQIDPNGDAAKLIKKSANVYLPHLLISLIETDSRRPIQRITTKTEASSALILVEYTEPFSIGELIDSLDSENETGGSFQQFIKDHYDAFRICGDFLIKDSDGRFALSFREDFKTTIDQNGKLKFTFVGNPNPIVATTKLTLEIKYNLFK